MRTEILSLREINQKTQDELKSYSQEQNKIRRNFIDMISKFQSYVEQQELEIKKHKRKAGEYRSRLFSPVKKEQDGGKVIREYDEQLKQVMEMGGAVANLLGLDDEVATCCKVPIQCTVIRLTLIKKWIVKN
jgi:hypothetical protein